MSNQDYISRAPVKKKKNVGRKPTKKNVTGRKTKAAVTKHPFNGFKPKLLILLSFLLICAFIYGLWLLKTSPNTNRPTSIPEPVKTKVKMPTEKAITALPTPPKEKWTYVKDLENKKIEVGKYEVKDQGPYKMQCGSFKGEQQAQTLKATIAFSGIASQIKTAKGTTNTWHKVVLGPYASKRLAEKDRHRLKRNNINNCQIWLWR
jgi:cell division protein FtsN